MKELIALVAGFTGKRYTERDKTRFLKLLSAALNERGVEKKLSISTGKGQRSCRNAVAGNLKEAELILAVPYDTGTRLLYPGAYKPADPLFNYRMDKINLLLNTVITLSVFFLYFFLVLRPFFPGGAPEIKGLIVIILAAVAFIGFRLLSGWPNKKNYNRNSSGVVLLLKGLLEGSWGEKTALAFMDRSCCSIDGYKALANKLKKRKSKAVAVLLDCICSGDEIFIHYRENMSRQAQKTADIFRSSFPTHLNLLTDELAETMAISCFSQAILITGGREENNECVIHDTRCGKDTAIDLVKMERLLHLLGHIEAELK